MKPDLMLKRTIGIVLVMLSLATAAVAQDTAASGKQGEPKAGEPAASAAEALLQTKAKLPRQHA